MVARCGGMALDICDDQWQSTYASEIHDDVRNKNSDPNHLDLTRFLLWSSFHLLTISGGLTRDGGDAGTRYLSGQFIWRTVRWERMDLRATWSLKGLRHGLVRQM